MMGSNRIEGFVYKGVKRMKLIKLPYEFSVCKVPSTKDIDLSLDFFFVGKTDEEVSLVCRTEDVPVSVTDREDGWRGFRFEGELDFSLVGVLSEISGILAKSEISIFAVSTFNTDYVLVKAMDYERAVDVLIEAGYTLEVTNYK